MHVAGFYTWIADYSGDANNTSATHACGLANETVHVLPTQGTITTDAIDHVKLSDGPTTISDQATLSGVTENPAAGGTIEFKVYGPFPTQPDANSCTEANLVGGGPYTGRRERSRHLHVARRDGEEGRLLRLGRQLLR